MIYYTPGSSNRFRFLLVDWWASLPSGCLVTFHPAVLADWLLFQGQRSCCLPVLSSVISIPSPFLHIKSHLTHLEHWSNLIHILFQRRFLILQHFFKGHKLIYLLSDLGCGSVRWGGEIIRFVQEIKWKGDVTSLWSKQNGPSLLPKDPFSSFPC